jgi:hypothetical protein
MGRLIAVAIAGTIIVAILAAATFVRSKGDDEDDIDLSGWG